jgi:hypothetical protein
MHQVRCSILWCPSQAAATLSAVDSLAALPGAPAMNEGAPRLSAQEATCLAATMRAGRQARRTCEEGGYLSSSDDEGGAAGKADIHVKNAAQGAACSVPSPPPPPCTSSLHFAGAACIGPAFGVRRQHPVVQNKIPWSLCSALLLGEQHNPIPSLGRRVLRFA